MTVNMLLIGVGCVIWCFPLWTVLSNMITTPVQFYQPKLWEKWVFWLTIGMIVVSVIKIIVNYGDYALF